MAENKTHKRIALFLVVCIAIIAFAAIVGGETNIYVRGEFGEHCYPKGQEHGNIKYILEFDSLEKCETY